MIGPRRLRGSHLVALPFALLASGCSIVLGLGDFTEGGGAGGSTTSTTSSSTSIAASSSGQPQVCTPGTQTSCLYTGPAGTVDIGPCHAGTQVCNAEGSGFEACAGEILPAPKEDCSNAVDDDCNGQLNDTCPCVPSAMAHCYNGPATTEGVGICVGGMQTCAADGNGYGPCAGEQKPLTEDCATPADEDCDGTPNQASAGCSCTPGAMQACYSGPAGTIGIGICTGGMQACNADGLGYGACVGDQKPLPEDCATPADDDCNGTPNQASAGCVCAPGTTAACYSGPTGTQGVGLCKGGMHTCNADGLGYGACVGEVLPTVDICSNATDEDCDGSVCGKTTWAKALTNINVNGIGVDGQGNIYVAGSLYGPFMMGAVSLSVVGGSGTDVVVLKLDPAGTPIWGKRFGSTANEAAYAIAVDTAGNVHLTGALGGAIDFGGGNLAAGVFVAKLDTAGNHLWSKACGGSTASPTSLGRGIAVDGTGNVLVTGSFGNTLSCAIGQSATSLGVADAFVLRMSGINGGPIWTKGFGDAANSQYGYGIAAAGNGDALVTGSFYGSINFGGGVITGSTSSGIFVTKLTAAAGAHVWSKGGGSGAQGSSIAVDATDNAIFIGSYSGTTMFAGKTLAAVGASADILFGKLDKATGTAAWLNGYGNTNGDSGNTVAVSGAGRIAIGGAFRNSADFGGGALASGGLDAAFLATFDATPTHLWSKQFSSSAIGPNSTNAVAFGPLGEVVAGGQFYGTVDFGQITLPGVSGGTAFLVRVAP